MNLIPALPMKVSELVYDELVPWSTGVGDKPFETVGFGLHVWTDGSLHLVPEIFESLTAEATCHTVNYPNVVTAPTIIDDTHVSFAGGSSSVVVGGTARLSEKVDLTYVDSITIRVPASCAGTGYGWNVQFGVFDAYTNANEYTFDAYLHKDLQGWDIDTDLDVSSLTGEYYVAFYVYAHTMTADVDLEFQNINFNGGD